MSTAFSTRAKACLLARMRRAEWIFPLALVLPTLIAVLAVIAYPWTYSMWLSLREIDFATKVDRFVGLDNYAGILTSGAFQEALLRTLYFAFVAVVSSILLGLGMALVLNERFVGRGFVRSVVLVPWAISTIAIGIVFSWIYDSQYGALNGVLYELGLIREYVAWLRDGFTALNLVALAHVWHQAPIVALLLLAGLQAIPVSLYRAAEVDGASAWQRFWRITLPWLRPMLLLTVILITINAVMQFDLIYIMTAGGPGNSTTVFSYLGYATTFRFFRMGEGAAILYTLSLLCVALAIAYARLLYSGERVGQPKGVSEVAPVAASAAWCALGSGGFARSPKTAIAARVKRRPLLGRAAKRLLGRGTLYFFVGLIVLWSLAPVVWLFICSVSNQSDLVSRPFRLIPRYPVISNYMDLFFGEIGAKGFQGVAQARKLHAGFANSIQICLAVTAINLAIGSLSGYAYARFARFWFMRSTLVALLLTRMIPGLTIVVPFFFLFSWANLLDTKTALVITYTAFTLPLVVWILRGYFETIPANLERAAFVDGCTRLQSLYRVVLPVSLPGITAAGIFSFVVAWNEFLFALILTKSPNAQPITMVLSGFATQMFQMGIGQGAVFAASVVAILPPTIIAFVLQRYLIQGMLSGSAKG